MDVKITPNFLPEPIFNQLTQIVFKAQTPWHLEQFIKDETNPNIHLTQQGSQSFTRPINRPLCYMNHCVFESSLAVPTEPDDQTIVGLLTSRDMYLKNWKTFYKLKEEPLPRGQFLEILPDKLIQIKINFYPNTPEICEYDYHVDYEYPHKGAILSLNTCDGYTKLRETDTKYPSVANTLLQFDSSKDHCGTTTTNALGRFNVNINYL